jgi:hypothetical protein
LVLVWEGKTLHVDVKSMTWHDVSKKYVHARPCTVAENVTLVSVDPLTYRVSFPANKTPEGWENFWP